MLYFQKFFPFILSVLAVACGNYDKVTEGPLLDTSRFSASDLSFASVKTQIFDTSCIRCHPGYANYNTVKKDINKIVGSVMSNRMPKNSKPVSDELKALLLAYVEAGAPRGDEVDATPTPVPVASWSYISENIIFPKCFVCHNPEGEASFVNLSTRQAIFEAREQLVNFENPDESYLLQIVQDEFEPMPPQRSNIERLTQDEIALLREWIRLGLP